MKVNQPKVLFFEWSDINRMPLSFLTASDFVNFCTNSNITVSKKNRSFLDENTLVYATCKTGKNELIMSGNHKNFRKNFSKHRNG